MLLSITLYLFFIISDPSCSLLLKNEKQKQTNKKLKENMKEKNWKKFKKEETENKKEMKKENSNYK